MTAPLPPRPGEPPLRHLSITHSSNRDHYYHFLLGVLLPLCRYLAETGETGAPILIASCGPLDALLNELRLPNLVITERRSHRKLRRTLPPELASFVTIDGYDLNDPSRPDYDGDAIRAAAAWLRRRWVGRIADRRKSLKAEWTERPRVMVINRAPADAYYVSSLARGDPAGFERRHVGNHAEMVAAIVARFPGCRDVFLEGRPLAEQIALFQLADIVVAQHGAALANIVWLRKGAEVVELDGGAHSGKHFAKLAAALGIPHRFFPQAGPFGPVDAPALAALIAAIAPTTEAPGALVEG